MADPEVHKFITTFLEIKDPEACKLIVSKYFIASQKFKTSCGDGHVKISRAGKFRRERLGHYLERMPLAWTSNVPVILLSECS